MAILATSKDSLSPELVASFTKMITASQKDQEPDESTLPPKPDKQSEILDEQAAELKALESNANAEKIKIKKQFAKEEQEISDKNREKQREL